MIHFDDAELPELPTHSQWADQTRHDTQERTRLGSQGEMMVELDSLIKVLRSQHHIDRIDRHLEFITPSPMLPDVFDNRQVDSVSVVLGESRLEALPGQKPPATYITLRLHAGNKTLILNRTSDPQLEEMEDYIETSHSMTEDDVTITQNFLERNISQAEFNAILVSLIAERPASASDFGEVDFLDAVSFSALSNELEARAVSKRVSGAYTFNDGDSAIEFSEQELIEYFEFTHTIKGGINPKTIAISGSTSAHSIQQFVRTQGSEIRVTSPEVSELDTLKSVAQAESASRLRKYRTQRTAGAFGLLALDDIEIGSDDTTQTDVIDTIADHQTKVRNQTFDGFLTTEILDQDGFNPPDSSAA